MLVVKFSTFIVKLKVKFVISVLVAKGNSKIFTVSKRFHPFPVVSRLGEEILFSTPEGVQNVHY